MKQVVEYPLAFRFISIGAEDVKARLEALIESYRMGSVSSEEFDRTVRSLHSSLLAKVRAVNMLSTAYRAAHPNLMLFTNALSALQSVAYRGLTLFNSYMLYQLRLGDAARDSAKAKEEAEKAERRYLDAVRLYGETAPEALKAKSDWIEAAEKAKEAAESEAKAQQELNIWLGLTALTAAGMASQLIANIGKITAGLIAAKAALAGLAGAVSASTIAVGALAGGLLILGGGLAASLANIIAHKDATKTWREAADEALNSVKGFPPVLRELLEVLTKAAGGWILVSEKVALFTSKSLARIVEWSVSVRERMNLTLLFETLSSALRSSFETLSTGLRSSAEAVSRWASDWLKILAGWSSSSAEAFSRSVSDWLNRLADWASSVAETFSKWVSRSLGELGRFTFEASASFSEWVSRGLAEVLRFTSTSASNLAAWVADWSAKVYAWGSENAKRFFDAASSFVKSLSDGLAGASAKILDALKAVGSTVTGFLANLAAEAWSWGFRLASSLADGIRAAISSIIAAAQEAASAIASILGVKSPAEQGPLSRLNEWGPNLVRTYADGIRGSLGVLREAALEAASTLSQVRTLGVVNVAVRVEGSSDIAREVSRRLALELGRMMP
ncbi:MAG: hypothetical protein QXJ86_06005 [Nitrososphaerales archaeon]